MSSLQRSCRWVQSHTGLVPPLSMLAVLLPHSLWSLPSLAFLHRVTQQDGAVLVVSVSIYGSTLYLSVLFLGWVNVLSPRSDRKNCKQTNQQKRGQAWITQHCIIFLPKGRHQKEKRFSKLSFWILKRSGHPQRHMDRNKNESTELKEALDQEGQKNDTNRAIINRTELHLS